MMHVTLCLPAQKFFPPPSEENKKTLKPILTSRLAIIHGMLFILLRGISATKLANLIASVYWLSHNITYRAQDFQLGALLVRILGVMLFTHNKS